MGSRRPRTRGVPSTVGDHRYVSSVKAVVVYAFGEPDALIMTEVDDPVAGPGQIRVRVGAAGTNPVDAGNRMNGSWAGLTAPCILGYDIAGVVDQVGPGVTGFRAGDRVMAMCRFPGGAGGYAELAVVDAELAAHLDSSTSFVHAAAAPLAAGTALTVLSRLDLSSGDSLLVLGASGGVGLFLLQLAAAQGVRTIALGRSEMHETMYRLGAYACIDYRTADVVGQAVTAAAGPVDAIADLYGKDMLTRTMPALRRHGRAASIATPDLNIDAFVDNNLTLHGVLIEDDGSRTRRIARLLGDGDLRPVISHVLPLADAAQAHRMLEGGHSGGKIVLIPEAAQTTPV